MRSRGKWVLAGVALVLVGVAAGVLITANYNLAPVSSAREPVQDITATRGARMAMAAGGLESPFVGVAKEVLPAVVSVDTKRMIQAGPDPFSRMLRQFFGDREYRDYFGDQGQENRKYEIPGSASGFIFDDRGYILTNNHVVEGADEIDVTLHDGREFSADVVGRDPSTDVAVIKIDGEDLPTVQLGDSDSLEVGDWAIAVGNPLELEGTVTVGVISAKGRTDLNIRGGTPLYQDFIQTDASINFGNSGGPLVNIGGEVVGVNSAINASANGIGFAIPINLAKSVADALMSEGKVVRGYLGVVPQPITQQLAEAEDLKSTHGVIVANIEDDTPASKAGLKAGDVIVEFGGTEITDVPQFRRVVASFGPNEEVPIIVLRDGKRLTLKATLVERPEQVAAAETQTNEPQEKTWFGIHAVGLNAPEAQQFEVQADEGVLVTSVESGSPAAHGGLEAGDVIVRIGDEPVKTMSDYNKIMSGLQDRKKAIAIMVQRGAYTYFVAVKPQM
jgi:serine protease Do